MANADVLDILSDTLTPTNRGSANKDEIIREKKKGPKKSIRRPEGMKREVWSLIAPDDRESVPIVPTDTKSGGNSYARWIKHSAMKVRPWQWTPFNNSARGPNDTFILYHWQHKTDPNDPQQEYAFAKFNKHVDVLTYTDNEYEQYLQDKDWTRTETDVLFELCRKFELKFLIIHDRWNNILYPDRSVEDLKERYYTICTTLDYARTKRHTDKYNFDAAHERRRKEQLNKLLSRTKAEEEEELYLMNELKRIENERKERERIISHDVQKFVQQQDPGIITTTTTTATTPIQRTVSSSSRRSSINQDYLQRLNSSSNRTPTTQRTTTFEPPAGIKFPEFKRPGVFLRSQRMILPTSIPNKKLAVIDQVLKQCQLERNPMACEEIVDEFNDLRSDIVLLFDLKNALNSAEYELQTSLHRLKSENGPTNVALSSTQPLSASSTSSNDNSKTQFDFLLSQPNTPIDNVTSPRLSDSFEPSNNVRSSTSERKRRALSSQTSTLKKRDRQT
ncbi:unnamed protein product [Adineta steineri]|uniref:DNA methyltransferase 1-associated protein 1 n=1 Tax=Adineta steineri TaxID=433720 RepID=A0A818PS75_9BILA|nr:unnamed protein product [Adineta steineri]CAF3629709.1 unnamed protein product [Adineta steineri]